MQRDIHDDFFDVYKALRSLKEAEEAIERVIKAKDLPEDVALSVARAGERILEAQNLLREARDHIGTYLFG